MGTYITLNIGGIDVAWAKNMVGENFGDLYEESNRKPLNSSEPDDDVDWSKESDINAKMAFTRPLREIVPRLEILGYSLDRIALEYQQATAYYQEQYCDVNSAAKILTFEGFCSFIREHPISSLDNNFVQYNEGEEFELKVKGIFHDNQVVTMLPSNMDRVANAYSERAYFGEIIGFLSPYSLLRLFAECEDNLNLDVIWQYGPLVDSGWASEQDFQPGISRSQAILIATEGGSDVQILKKALSILRPDVADFFRFSDTSTHPSSGTSGLVMLAKALCQIDTVNSILFVFDNDAEGCEAAEKVNALPLTPNLRSMVLPDLEDFNCFPTLGPDGMTTSNINGRAAAIECYLDLRLANYPPPYVTWTNRKSNDTYHGALKHKESYFNYFRTLNPDSIEATHYDFSKLVELVDCIIGECCAMSSARFSASFNKAHYEI